jgi:glycerol-3-phosphate dehydrogenase
VLASQIDEGHVNKRYLPGYPLPPGLHGTADLEKAIHDVDLLVVGVPTRGFRAILADARSEGVGTAFTARELAERHGIQMPVCHEVYRVLTAEIPASEAYRGLRKLLPPGHEREPG